MTGRILLRLSPIAIVLAATACGGGGGTKTVTVVVTQTVTQTVPTPKRIAVRVYLVRNGKVAPVARIVPSTARVSLLRALATGPSLAEQGQGFTTQLSGAPKTDQLGRIGLAQVVYTLSQFNPSGSIDLNGHSYTRADFEDETPAILVESPLPFQPVNSPLEATGTANTFEATFQYELTDANGNVLGKHFVTASSGSGIRGTFAATIPFAVPNAGPGKLTVFEVSAKDGSRIHQVEIPLTLEP